MLSQAEGQRSPAHHLLLGVDVHHQLQKGFVEERDAGLQAKGKWRLVGPQHIPLVQAHCFAYSLPAAKGESPCLRQSLLALRAAHVRSALAHTKPFTCRGLYPTAVSYSGGIRCLGCSEAGHGSESCRYQRRLGPRQRPDGAPGPKAPRKCCLSSAGGFTSQAQLQAVLSCAAVSQKR